jgi:hypothetical protein
VVVFSNLRMYRAFYKDFKKLFLPSVLIFLRHSNFFVLCEQKKEEFLLILENEVLLVEVIPRTQITLVLVDPCLNPVAVKGEELGVNALNFDLVIANADADRAAGLAPAMLNAQVKKNNDINFETINHDYIIYMLRDRFNLGPLPKPGIRTFQPQPPAFERLRTPDPFNEEGVRFTRVGLDHFFKLMEHLRVQFITRAEPVRENFIYYFERYFFDIGYHNVAFFRIGRARITEIYTNLITTLQPIIQGNIDKLWHLKHRTEFFGYFREHMARITEKLYFTGVDEDNNVIKLRDFTAMLLDKFGVNDLWIVERIIPLIDSAPMLTFMAFSMVSQTLYGRC